jgi:hypothetical protein
MVLPEQASTQAPSTNILRWRPLIGRRSATGA